MLTVTEHAFLRSMYMSFEWIRVQIGLNSLLFFLFHRTVRL